MAATLAVNELALSGPALSSLEALHRHRDGYVSFALKNGEDWRPSFAIRADVLRNMFPQFREQLFKDSFVSINAAYCLATKNTRKVHGWPAHRSENLRYLCACYCDIDFYKVALSYQQALEQVDALWKAGRLPQASVIVGSGRGMWLLWFLHDENAPNEAHLGAFRDNPNDHLQLYSKINRSIGRHLAFVGSDPAATDPARYMRVPGSFRTDVEEIVEWSVQAKADGSAPSYTLKQLADFFGIKICPRLPQEKEALAESKKKVGNKSTGWRAANRNKLAVFTTLKDLRAGGFDEGCRNYAALIYATCLKWNGVTRKDALSALQVMAEQCRPKLSVGGCAGAIKSAYKPSMRKMSYQWMANVLLVCPEEATLIAQQIGKPFPSASKFGGVLSVPPSANKETRDMKMAIRRLEIRKIVDALGIIPSYRVMRGQLLNVGIEVAHATIMADYKALNLISQRAQSPRGPKQIHAIT